MATEVELAPALPAGWHAVRHVCGLPVFVHTDSGAVTWTAPYDPRELAAGVPATASAAAATTTRLDPQLAAAAREHVPRPEAFAGALDAHKNNSGGGDSSSAAGSSGRPGGEASSLTLERALMDDMLLQLRVHASQRAQEQAVDAIVHGEVPAAASFSVFDTAHTGIATDTIWRKPKVNPSAEGNEDRGELSEGLGDSSAAAGARRRKNFVPSVALRIDGAIAGLCLSRGVADAVIAASTTSSAEDGSEVGHRAQVTLVPLACWPLLDVARKSRKKQHKRIKRHKQEQGNALDTARQSSKFLRNQLLALLGLLVELRQRMIAISNTCSLSDAALDSKPRLTYGAALQENARICALQQVTTVSVHDLDPRGRAASAFFMEYAAAAAIGKPSFTTTVLEGSEEPFCTCVALNSTEVGRGYAITAKESKERACECALQELCPELWAQRNSERPVPGPLSVGPFRGPLPSAIREDLKRTDRDASDAQLAEQRASDARYVNTGDNWRGLAPGDARVLLLDGRRKTPMQVVQEHCKRHHDEMHFRETIIERAVVLPRSDHPIRHAVTGRIAFALPTLQRDLEATLVLTASSDARGHQAEQLFVGRGTTRTEAKQQACARALCKMYPHVRTWGEMSDLFSVYNREAAAIYSLAPNTALISRLRASMRERIAREKNKDSNIQTANDHGNPDVGHSSAAGDAGDTEKPSQHRKPKKKRARHGQ